MWKRNWIVIAVSVFVLVVFQNPVWAEETLSLDEAIQTALKNSHVIKIAREGKNEAVAQKNEALTGFLPKISTTYNYTRINEEPVIKFQGLPMPYSSLGEVPIGSKDNYTWSFELRQPLFAGGAIWANYQASRIGESVAAQEETAKYQDVVQEVKIAYFNLLRAKRIKDVALQSVEMLKAHRNVAKDYFEVGMIPKNDLLQAEVELANGNQNLIRVNNAVELAKSNFNKVLKREIITPVRIVDILTYQPLKQSYEECLIIARKERPELKISSLRVMQAEKMVRLSQSEFFPALNLVGTYQRNGDTPATNGSAYKDMENWQVMAVASWNLWEWGKTKFRVDAARARESRAQEVSKELNDQIALEIKNAYLLLQEAESQIIVSQKVIEQAEENFRISEERYKQSIATSTVVLEAQTLLTKAKSEYANALGDYNINYAKLQRAMGTFLKADPNDKIQPVAFAAKNAANAEEKGPDIKESVSSKAAVPVTENPVPVVKELNEIKTVAAENVRAEEHIEADVKKLVDQWRAGWQSGNMDIYAGCYAPDFKSDGMDLNAWIAYKNRIYRKNKPLTVRIENLKISSDAQTSVAKAVFTQYYNSPVFEDAVVKTLLLRKIKGAWKIYDETVGSSGSEEEVRNLVNKWWTAWQSGDMGTYARCYAPDFKNAGMDLKKWISYKARTYQKNKPISLRLEDMKIVPIPGTADIKAVFTQYYSSSTYRDTIEKTLMLRSIQGEWKIYRETGAPLQ